MDKNDVKKWLKDPLNLLLVLLIIFTVGLKLYHFSLTMNQPTWWDEGDYLAIAKEIAIPSPETPEWWGHFISMRPPLMSLIWALFIKFGISEAAMRFLTEIIPSIILVIFMYLLASSLFNKRVGLIAGFLTSVYWVIGFYGHRFMTDIPAMMFVVMSCYYFWEYYVKENKPRGLYLGIFLGVLGFLTRFPTALVTFGILVYLLIVKRHKFFADKHIWIAGGIGILSLTPYLLYLKLTLGSWFPAAAFYGSANTAIYNTFAWLLFPMLPQFIGWILLIFGIIGLGYSLIEIVFGGDIILKRGSNKLDNHLFVLIWILLEIIYFVFIIRTGNDRWILLWMPPIFMYIGIGIDKISEHVEEYLQYGAKILIIVLFVFAGYNQLYHGDQLLKQKLDSYKEVKDTGLWLRENTPENAKIMCASIVQNTFYSQRRSYDFYIGTETQVQVNNSVLDPQGRVIASTYKTLRNETELECKIVRIKPDYLVLHIWEPEFTPEFMYDYAQRHQDILNPLQAFQRNGQTSAVIYKFTGYPKIDSKKVNCTWVYERQLGGVNGNRTLKEVSPERLIIPS
jgi:hypothetical protein